jgi:hypothetical protein
VKSDGRLVAILKTSFQCSQTLENGVHNECLIATARNARSAALLLRQTSGAISVWRHARRSSTCTPLMSRATAMVSSAEVLIAHQRLAIDKMKRELYGARSERGRKLLDQMKLELEELGAG